MPWSNKEIQDSIFGGKINANHFLGLKKAYTGRLTGKWMYDQQCSPGQQSETSDLHQTAKANVKKSVVVASQLKLLTNWILRWWNTSPTAQISHLPFIIFLNHSKMIYDVTNFLCIKWRNWCMNGCMTNWKPSSRMEYATL